MGEGRVVSRGAAKELGPQAVGHPGCLGAWGDGAVAHRPQAGVLAETENSSQGREGTEMQQEWQGRGTKAQDPMPSPHPDHVTRLFKQAILSMLLNDHI